MTDTGEILVKLGRMTETVYIIQYSIYIMMGKLLLLRRTYMTVLLQGSGLLSKDTLRINCKMCWKIKQWVNHMSMRTNNLMSIIITIP